MTNYCSSHLQQNVLNASCNMFCNRVKLLYTMLQYNNPDSARPKMYVKLKRNK